jgi:hypothetical protein
MRFKKMRAIITKYYSETNTLPARIKAADLNNECRVFISAYTDEGLEGEALHRAAAQELINKYNWQSRLSDNSGGYNDGFVFLLEKRINRA